MVCPRSPPRTVFAEKFQLTSYKDKRVEIVEKYPTHGIHAAVKKILKKIPPELLNTIHVDEEKP